jgi:hypothetical protein
VFVDAAWHDVVHVLACNSYNVSVFAVADVGSGQATYMTVTTLASTAAAEEKSSSSNTGAILGGVIGGFVALILIIVLVRAVWVRQTYRLCCRVSAINVTTAWMCRRLGR